MLLFLAGTARAQRWSDMVWKPVLRQDSVAISYIFYARADGQHNGVVLRIDNFRHHPVHYRFTVVFRSASEEVAFPVEGVVPARSMVTGDRHGLFWIPFKDGQEVQELGLRRWRFYVRSDSSSLAYLPVP